VGWLAWVRPLGRVQRAVPGAGGVGEARDSVDALLAKASGSMPGKTAKRARKEAKAKAALPKPPKMTMKSMLRADLASPSPLTRETARRLLERM
jgi:hypothetical protein